MSATWKTAFAGVLFLYGCAHATEPSAPLSLDGNWTFTTSYSSTELGGACSITAAAVTFVQTGLTFNGTITSGSETCIVAGLGSPQDISGALLGGGQITGSSLMFSSGGGCQFSGNGTGSPANSLGGNVACTAMVSGKNYPLTGTWEAHR
jgi:hypothetical protein